MSSDDDSLLLVSYRAFASEGITPLANERDLARVAAPRLSANGSKVSRKRCSQAFRGAEGFVPLDETAFPWVQRPFLHGLPLTKPRDSAATKSSEDSPFSRQTFPARTRSLAKGTC